MINLRKGLLRASFLTAACISLGAAADTRGVSDLNELLRGERSAIETYTQALEKVGSEPGAVHLKENLKNHQEAVAEISSEIERLGGSPTTNSGAWGLWAKTVTGSAKLLGDTVALKALKEGEQHGVKEYQEILEKADVPSDFKSKVRTKFLPQQQSHIATIDSMISQVS